MTKDWRHAWRVRLQTRENTTHYLLGMQIVYAKILATYNQKYSKVIWFVIIDSDVLAESDC